MSIQLIIGPMFSGKTTELLRRVKRYRLAGRSCAIIKNSIDTRYSNVNLSTHDQVTDDVPVFMTKLSDFKNSDDYEVIAIDEGQFFEDLSEQCVAFASMGIIVIVSALDGTFRQTPFNNVSKLIPLCEKLDKLSAICTKCGNEAAFTIKTSSGNQEIEVGGAESYTPVCRSCL